MLSGARGSSSSYVTTCTASSFSQLRPKSSCSFSTPQPPGTAEQVLAQQWLYETGMPPHAPVFTSAQLEELRSLAQAWTAGARPTAAQPQQWSPLEVLVFLQHLPRALDHVSLAWLDAQLHLTGRGDYEILVEWLTIAAGLITSRSSTVSARC